MQSGEVDPRDSLIESPALDGGKLKLGRGGLARSVGALIISSVICLFGVQAGEVRGLTAKVPAPQGEPPRTSELLARMGKACLYPKGT